MFTFATDYYIFVFTATLGVMQVAVSLGNLRGLLVFKSRVLARSLGVAIALAAAVWFFTSETRNLNDQEGGLDANEQALFFFPRRLDGRHGHAVRLIPGQRSDERTPSRPR